MANLGFDFGFEELKRINDSNFGDSTTGIGKYNVRRSDVTYDENTRPVITSTGEYLLDFEKRFEENLIKKEQLVKKNRLPKKKKQTIIIIPVIIMVILEQKYHIVIHLEKLLEVVFYSIQ